MGNFQRVRGDSQGIFVVGKKNPDKNNKERPRNSLVHYLTTYLMQMMIIGKEFWLSVSYTNQVIWLPEYEKS